LKYSYNIQVQFGKEGSRENQGKQRNSKQVPIYRLLNYRLRTGYILLNNILACIRIEESAVCIYRTRTESVFYFLFYCPK
jgi:hypothetical protein